jgi:hypothetical protein
LKITIPASVQEATSRLGGLERLLVATEWERAAIVATFVVPLDNGGDRRSTSAKTSTDLTPTAFAELGIAGLRSKDTVRRYVEAWNQSGLPRPVPGDTVELPNIEFPSNQDAGRNVRDEGRKKAIRDQAKADGTGASKAINVASNPKAMAAAIKADPQTAKAAVEALSEEIKQQIAAEIIKAHPEVAVTATEAAGYAVIRTTDPELEEKMRQAGRRTIRDLDAHEDADKDRDTEMLAEVSLIAQKLATWRTRAWRVTGLNRVRDMVADELDLAVGAESLTPEMFSG